MTVNLSEEDIPTTLLAWVDAHAGLEKLCERGGWPDGSTLRLDVCDKAEREWIVDVFFEEVVQEISECVPTRDVRCGQFVIVFDEYGEPQAIRLLHPM